MRWPMIVLAAGLSFLAGLIKSSCLHAQETPQNILAAHIRAQGFACDEPLTAKRDVKLSGRDHAVWTLTCSNASYRIGLVPDVAAQVEQVQ